MTAPDSRDSVVLLPCPFCGHDESLYIEHVEGTILHPAYYVRCDYCGAQNGATDKGDHVKEWNRQALARGPQQAGGEDAKDAARYRALRNDTYIDRCDIAALSDTDMDAALDAAIASATDAPSTEARTMLDREVVENLERLATAATQGEWVLATSCSWRRIITSNGRPVIVPSIQRSDNHLDLDCGDDHVNAELACAAVNALPELLRVYRAWLDAPQAVASDAEVIALAGGNHWHAKIALLGPAAKELGGQRVRLVRDGDSGEGESC